MKKEEILKDFEALYFLNCFDEANKEMRKASRKIKEFIDKELDGNIDIFIEAVSEDIRYSRLAFLLNKLIKR